MLPSSWHSQCLFKRLWSEVNQSSLLLLMLFQILTIRVNNNNNVWKSFLTKQFNPFRKNSAENGRFGFSVKKFGRQTSFFRCIHSSENNPSFRFLNRTDSCFCGHHLENNLIELCRSRVSWTQSPNDGCWKFFKNWHLEVVVQNCYVFMASQVPWNYVFLFCAPMIVASASNLEHPSSVVHQGEFSGNISEIMVKHGPFSLIIVRILPSTNHGKYCFDNWVQMLG